jgi:YtkA-like
MPKLRILFLSLLATVMIACAPPDPNKLVILPETKIAPSGAGPTSFIFKVVQAGNPLAGAKVTVQNTMTHAGMVPTIRIAQEIGQGVYQAQNLEFQMAGDYVLIVTAEKNGEKLSGEYRFGVQP